jgi:YihY family inner membrane protein
MSTAAEVPETFELTGDDARKTLAHTGRWRLLRDAFVRLRAADGFSHARSMAYLGGLVLVQGTIAMVGLASAFGKKGVGTVIVKTFHSMFPGPAGRVLTTTVRQAQTAGLSGRYAGLVFGLVGGLIAATTLFGQMERGLNRMYGIEQDRPSVQKYGRAFVMALTVGLLTAAAFVALAFGREIGDAFDSSTVRSVWGVVRWPLGLGFMAASMALLFRIAPRRHQPAWSWLAFGATVSVVLWAAVTAGLGLFFRWSSSFGETYGPLAGIVALMIWSLLSAIAVLFGGAVAAQLEAVRSSQPGPRDPEKVDGPVKSKPLMSVG